MKDLILLAWPDILLIQETKMEKETFLQVSAKFQNKGGSAAISSRGASRGIGTLWDEQKFEVDDIIYSSHWILTVLLHKENKILVRIFNIYAPNSYTEKKMLESPPG